MRFLGEPDWEGPCFIPMCCLSPLLEATLKSHWPNIAQMIAKPAQNEVQADQPTMKRLGRSRSHTHPTPGIALSRLSVSWSVTFFALTNKPVRLSQSLIAKKNQNFGQFKSACVEYSASNSIS